MLEKFGGGFPNTNDFSAYARSTIPNVLALDAPDAALLAWMEREEILFRTLKKHPCPRNFIRCFTKELLIPTQ